METAPKKRVGRPPKAASEKAETFSVRLLPEVRAKLEEAAEKAGRSLAAEISARLEASFTGPLTYVLLDRRMQELHELNERLSATLTVQSYLQAELASLEGVKGAEADAKRVNLQAEHEVLGWDAQTVKEQITRVESEAKSLLDDLARKVSLTAEQVLKHLPDR